MLFGRVKKLMSQVARSFYLVVGVPFYSFFSSKLIPPPKFIVLTTRYRGVPTNFFFPQPPTVINRMMTFFCFNSRPRHSHPDFSFSYIFWRCLLLYLESNCFSPHLRSSSTHSTPNRTRLIHYSVFFGPFFSLYLYRWTT